MNWWILVHFYLWRNSFRRWFEQPLSLLSKLVISALLGILGAVIILGVRELGAQLDRRLNDQEALTAVITQTFNAEAAVSRLESGSNDLRSWKSLPGEAGAWFLAAAYADLDMQKNLPVLAVEKMEELVLLDDFYILSDSLPEGRRVEFQIGDHRSEATVIRPTAEMNLVLGGRSALLGELERLLALYGRGFTETTVYRANSVAALKKADQIVETLSRVEDRRIFIRSNLRILLELEKIRALQGQALIGVTLVSSAILGLVLGSLAWMEFREERYLLALVRTFGVGSLSLLLHSLIENSLLAVTGVLLGFGALHLGTRFLNLQVMNLGWLNEVGTFSFLGGDGLLLLLGAALGGLLSGLPVALGLRKPLGLVLS